MELIARFLISLTVYAGWVAAPIHAALSYLPNKWLPPPKQTDILNVSAAELADKIRKRQVTSERVVRAFVERCRQVNGRLNAIVEDRFAAAIEEAKRVDASLATGEKSVEQLRRETPLLGLPVTVKEACKLRGMSHCVGSKMRVGIKADADGTAVANVKRAGAIPIAVTNTPELCASVETFNFVTGYTANPHDLSRSSGGSSGGEAALISCGSSPLGIGSDFAGSIRVPCLFTGIFGHKPTPGIVSNEGHYPNLPDKEFQKLLTLGPISRYARDLRLGLRVMAGEGAAALRLDSPVNVGDLRIFYAPDQATLTELSVDGDMKRAIRAALVHFESVRGCLVDQLELPQLKDCLEMCVMQNAEMENMGQIFHLKGDENEASAMVELLKSLLRVSDYCLQTVIVRFVVETLLFIPRSKRFAYEAKRNDLRNALKDVLGENGVLLFPTFASAAFHKYELVWKTSSLHYPMIVNVLGFPATQIPAGLNAKGLPIGFQVIAAPKQDRLCLAVAEELENVFGGWIAPKYVA